MPNSQLVTAPDLIESILIVNADKSQRDAVVLAVAKSENSYNLYTYQSESGEFQWLDRVSSRVQTILMNSAQPEIVHGSGRVIRFGPGQEIVEPAEYFDK